MKNVEAMLRDSFEEGGLQAVFELICIASPSDEKEIMESEFMKEHFYELCDMLWDENPEEMNRSMRAAIANHGRQILGRGTDFEKGMRELKQIHKVH